MNENDSLSRGKQQPAGQSERGAVPDAESEFLRTVARLVEEALDLESLEARASWLSTELARQPEAVHREVERWLDAQEHSHRLLDQPEELPSLLRSAPPAGFNAVEVGQHIGPHTVLELLGRGGMGEVWKARQDPPLERTVALKVIRPGVTSEHLLHRFEAERRAIAQTSHPNIAKVYDTGVTESGQPYFAMEWVDGPSISTWCREHAAPLEQRLQLVQCVCDAIQHAHRQGVLHRDLKPSNVLVSTVGGEPKPWVIDFGIAKLSSGLDAAGEPTPADSVAGITREHVALGTPDYMSPEQAAGGPVDTRTDVFALGAVLYELVCGRAPRVHHQIGAAAEGAMWADFVPPSRLVRRNRSQVAGSETSADAGADSAADLPYTRLPRELDWITRKALAENPDDRYATPSELADDLRDLLAGRPVAAAPPALWYVARRFAARNRITVTLAGFILLSLVLGIVSTSLMARSAAAARDDALREAGNAQAVAGFLTEVLEAADPNMTARADVDRRALEVRVVDLLAAAAVRLSDSRMSDAVRASLRHTLGTTYLNLSRYSEAEDLLAAAVDTRTRLLGAEHPNTLASAHNLAVVYKSQNRIDEAIDLLRRTYFARVGSLGAGDPETLVSRSNLAELMLIQGDLEAARDHFAEVLDGLDRHYGREHERSIAARSNLGFVQRRLGETEVGERLFREALDLARRALPTNHPHRVDALNNLAAHLYAPGGSASSVAGDHAAEQLVEAERLLREALDLSTILLGSTHTTTLNTRNNLAVVQMRLGELGSAEDVLSQSLEDHRTLRGEEHPSTLLTRNNLAQVLSRLGEHRAALAHYDVLIPLTDRVLAPHHPYRSSFHIGRAKVLAASGDAARGAERLASFHAFLVGELGDDHPRAMTVRAALESLEASAAEARQR